jgi:AraC-like DNA-binding protein
MLEAFKILILSTIIVTLWTAFLLLQDKRGIPSLHRWFAVFLVALTTPQMDLYAAHTVQGGILLLALVASTFLWLKGPFIWIFLSVLTRNDTRLKRVWFHFVPWLTALTATLLFPQAGQTLMLLGMAHMLVYLFLALWRLFKKHQYILEVWNGFQNTAYYWLLYIIGGLMLLVAIDFVVMSMVILGVINTYALLDYVAFPTFSIYVLSIAILIVYRPQLISRKTEETQEIIAVNTDLCSVEHVDTNADFKDTAGVYATLKRPLKFATGNSPNKNSTASARGEIPFCESNPAESNSDEPHQTKRYLELNEPVAQQLLQQLNSLMLDQQVYRQNEMSLPQLAQILNISVHQLSELLNVHLGMSFYDYINGFRLGYACDLLRASGCQLRVLDIAFESGFNNKNSFYRAFKENLGVTPNEYRERLESKSV